MEYTKIIEENRIMANQFIIKHWGSTKIIIHGDEYDLAIAHGVLAIENEQVIGLVTFVFYNYSCEIMTLDCDNPNHGIGTELLKHTLSLAQEANCNRIALVTTNDNTDAMRFFQKRGFDMVRLYHNAINENRKTLPHIPLIGDHEIPKRHEIEFEFQISK